MRRLLSMLSRLLGGRRRTSTSRHRGGMLSRLLGGLMGRSRRTTTTRRI